MLYKLATVSLVALFSLSPPVQDDQTALKREIDGLKAQQEAIIRDLDTIKAVLQELLRERAQAALLNAAIPIAGEPTKGSPTAKVTLVEVSDYQCPFCRRHTLTTQPQIDANYINNGKVRYVFIDYPIAQLHPEAYRAHEAANCAGDQGKYWEMHAALFATPPPRDPAQVVTQLVSNAQSIGVNATTFKSCLDGGKYSKPVKENISRMADLGVDSTPTFLVGLTPAPGQPMKVLKVVKGAVPYSEFERVLDGLLTSP
jgi:protein-disulfide isomerase